MQTYHVAHNLCDATNFISFNDPKFSGRALFHPVLDRKMLFAGKHPNFTLWFLALWLNYFSKSQINKIPLVSLTLDKIKIMLFQNKASNYSIQNLIQLKLIPILIESAQRQVNEEFKSIVLKPLYIDQSLNKCSRNCDTKFLRSDYSQCLNSITCMIATQQEGYLYHFDDAGKFYQ